MNKVTSLWLIYFNVQWPWLKRIIINDKYNGTADWTWMCLDLCRLCLHDCRSLQEYYYVFFLYNPLTVNAGIPIDSNASLKSDRIEISTVKRSIRWQFQRSVDATFGGNFIAEIDKRRLTFTSQSNRTVAQRSCLRLYPRSLYLVIFRGNYWIPEESIKALPRDESLLLPLHRCL